MNRRRFLVRGSQAALGGTLLSQWSFWPQSSLQGAQQATTVDGSVVRGGLSFVSQWNELLRDQYRAFFQQKIWETEGAPKVSAREGTYKQSFGFYFHHRIVEFGVTSGALMHREPGFRLFGGLPSLDGELFAKNKQDFEIWHQVYGALGTYPMVFAESTGGSVYLRRRGHLVAPGSRIAGERHEASRLMGLGFSLQSAGTLDEALLRLVHGSADLTDSFPLSKASAVVSRLEQLCPEMRERFDLVYGTRLLPEAHHELLVRRDVWSDFSKEMKTDLTSAVDLRRRMISERSEAMKSEVLAALSNKIDTQEELRSDLSRFAEKIEVARQEAMDELEGSVLRFMNKKAVAIG